MIGWKPEMVQVHFTLDLEDLMTKEMYMTFYITSSVMDNVSWSIEYHISSIKKGGSNTKLKVVAIACFVIGS